MAPHGKGADDRPLVVGDVDSGLVEKAIGEADGAHAQPDGEDRKPRGVAGEMAPVVKKSLAAGDGCEPCRIPERGLTGLERGDRPGEPDRLRAHRQKEKKRPFLARTRSSLRARHESRAVSEGCGESQRDLKNHDPSRPPSVHVFRREREVRAGGAGPAGVSSAERP